jgi:RND family efflux transporter MFP subunit
MSDQLSSDLASLRIARDDPPRRGGGTLLKWLAITAAIAGGGFAFVKVGVPELEARIFKTEVRVTEVLRLSPAQGSIDLTATGYVLAERSIAVTPKVVGRVVKIAVRENDDVKAGQFLFELDATEQRAAVASARAKVMAGEARAKAAHAEVLDLKQQWERQKQLTESGTVGRAVSDDLEAKMHTQEATALASEAEAHATSAEVAVLATQLDNYRFVSPMDGRIVNRPPLVGDLVTMGQRDVFSIVDFNSLYVETDVPEARLSQVKKGGPAEVILDAYPDVRMQGTVLEITPRVNRSKATVIVKVGFRDPDRHALPEMAARVSFLAKAVDEAALKEPPKTVVPGSAIAERAGGKVVFLIENGKTKMVSVTLGPKMGDGFEVMDGVAAGARVVRDPPATLADGTPVKEKVDG